MTQITAYFDSRDTGGRCAGVAAAFRNGLPASPVSAGYGGDAGVKFYASAVTPAGANAPGPASTEGCRAEVGIIRNAGGRDGGRPGGLFLVLRRELRRPGSRFRSSQYFFGGRAPSCSRRIRSTGRGEAHPADTAASTNGGEVVRVQVALLPLKAGTVGVYVLQLAGHPLRSGLRGHPRDRSMAITPLFDFGAVHKRMTASARGRRASGMPSCSAASTHALTMGIAMG